MPECSTPMSEMESRLRRLRTPEPEPGFEARLLAVPTLEAARPRRSFIRWARPYLVTSTVGLALALGAVLIVSSSRAVPAFARVEEALKEIRTATWKETQTTYLSGEVRGRSVKSHVWVRTQPPARAHQREDGARTLLDGRWTRNYAPGGHYSRWRWPLETDFGRAIILSPILSPGANNADAPEKEWEATRTVHEGRPAVRYEREFRWGDKDLPASYPEAQRYVRRNVTTLWVEPETLRVLRSEHRQFDTRDERLENLVVAEGFRYNEQLPTEVFAWKVPAGKREEDVSSRELTPDEQAACRKMIEGAEAAWTAGDFSAFAAYWDFDYLERFRDAKAGHGMGPIGPALRTFLKQQLSARGGLENPWTSWKSEELNGSARRSLSPFAILPEEEPDIVRFEAQSSVVQADGSNWPVKASYYLAKREGGYRIIHWRHDLPHQVLWGK